MLLCFRAVGGYLVQPAFLRCFEVGFCSFDLFIFKREVLRLLGERKDKLLGSVSSPQLFSTVRDFALRLSTETVFPPFLCTRRSGRAGQGYLASMEKQPAVLAGAWPCFLQLLSPEWSVISLARPYLLCCLIFLFLRA